MALVQQWRRQLESAAVRSTTPAFAAGGEVWLLRWALVCGSVAAALYLVCGYQAGFERLNTAAATLPPWMWQYATVLGDGRLCFALTLFFGWRYPKLLWALVLAALVAVLYSRGLKALFDTPRPPALLSETLFQVIGEAHRRASFPSGHSVTAAVFFGVLLAHARRLGWRLLFLTLAVIAGLSRVAVGVHWPVDVAAGLMGGALAAWLGTHWAARWSRPATDPAVHLAWVAVAAILAVGLFYDDGGYPAARPLLHAVAIGGLLTAAVCYLLLPLARAGGMARD